ncbi:hypothetical protein [Foetidibacter luteolus]|uniref:hypothetical protein n=1 Tax=Foetidibacter luteolus TaxID=2608880 RepID=UPI00129B914C|nr:hypothetical protein [Foetidibacter luteolus]
MNSVKNVGLLYGGFPGKELQFTGKQNYRLKKILVKEDVTPNHDTARNPNTEIVHDKNDILQDESIDLVIISDHTVKDVEFAAEALRAGKYVRLA